MTTNEMIHVDKKESAWENVRKQNQVLEWYRRRRKIRGEQRLLQEKRYAKMRDMMNGTGERNMGTET